MTLIVVMFTVAMTTKVAQLFGSREKVDLAAGDHCSLPVTNRKCQVSNSHHDSVEKSGHFFKKHGADDMTTKVV